MLKFKNTYRIFIPIMQNVLGGEFSDNIVSRHNSEILECSFKIKEIGVFVFNL